ncbi:uncharacterized protein LOC124166741 [Ischnura elegans]|uniref:uncharacterized protein LOC124166741 n=1 Tax=Ischnura elegans TaxID=197161 RepID=UPI001ED87E52|nr:uncharacterized protein LOC124166741 [Ischnura elegans]
MRRQEHKELHPQQTTPSRQYFGQTSPECKCSCHSNYQMHSSQNMTRKDYGDAWEGGERTHHSRTHCRKHNKPSMEETNRCQRSTGHVGGGGAGQLLLLRAQLSREEDSGEVQQICLPICKSTKKWNAI